MKLHINKSLRAALMACYAVVASFTTTVTTGTLATGVVAYSLLAEDVAAQANVEVTITGQGNGGIGPNTGTYTDYVLTNFAGGWFGGGDFGWTAPKIYVQNWKQSAGSTSEKLVVNGNLTDFTAIPGYKPAAGETAATHVGTGDIEFAASQNAMDHDHVFNGDHSAFSGDFIVSVDAANRGKSFVFTNRNGTGDLTDVSGTGAIQLGVRTGVEGYTNNVVAHDAIFFYTGNVTIGNTVIHADFLSLNGKNEGNNTSDGYKTSRTADTGTDGATYTISSALTLNTLELNDASTAILTEENSVINSVDHGGGGKLQIGNAGSLTLVNAFALGDGNITINQGGTLVVGQALTLTGMFQNDGTLAFAENATLDLTGATVTVENGIYQYSIFEGAGNIDVTNLTNASIIGVRGITDKSVIGYKDGMLTISGISSNLLTYAGSADPVTPTPLDWNGVNVFDDGTTSFSDGDSVSFSGHTAANLTNNVNVDELTVDADSSLSIRSTGEYSLSFGVGAALGANAVLNIDHAIMKNTTPVSVSGVATSSLFFTGATAKDVALASFVNLTGFSGELRFDNATVTAAAVADFGAVSTLTLGEGTTLRTGGLALGRVLNIAGNTTVTTTTTAGTTTLTQVTGDGSITFNGAVAINGNVGFTGDIIFASGISSFGTGEGSTNTIAASSITIKSGAQFNISHSVGDFSSADLVMEGATLRGGDMAANTVTTFKSLTLTGDNIINHQWNGRFAFGVMTGSGTLAYNPNAAAGEIGDLRINSINNYNGTVTLGASSNADSILFGGAIHQDADNHLVVSAVDGAAGLLEVHENATFTGAGSVSFNSSVTIWAAKLVDSTLNLTSYQFGSDASQLTAIGGNLNLNGATFDSATNGVVQLGATIVGSTQDTVTWADSIQVGAYETDPDNLGTEGTVDAPIYTTINTAKTDGSGTVAMTLSGSISNFGNSVGALKLVGAGSVTLSGASSFTGGIVIEDASVILGSTSAAGLGAIDMASGSLNVGGNAIRNVVNYNGGTLSGLSGFAGTLHVNENLAVTDGISGMVNVAAGKSLTLGGEWTYASSIANAGTVTLAADMTMDLSKAAFTRISDGEYSLTLIDGGTIDASAWLTGGVLDVTKLSGLVTEGREYSYDNGKLSYTLTAPFREWNTNDALNWEVGTVFNGGAFAENDNVTFAAGIDTDVTLLEAITANVINIEQNAVVEFVDSEFVLTVNEIYMSEGAQLTVGDDLSANLIAMETDAWLSISNIGSDMTISMSGTASIFFDSVLSAGEISLENIIGGDASGLVLRLSAEGTTVTTPLFTGNLSIAEGELLLENGNYDFNSIDLEANSSVRVTQALSAGINDLSGITGGVDSAMKLSAAGGGSTVTLSDAFTGGVTLNSGSLMLNGSDFGGVTSFSFGNGAGLVANVAVAEGAAPVVSTFAHDINILPVEGANSVFHVRAGIRNEVVLTGDIIGDDTAIFAVTVPGTNVTISGGNMENFTGQLSIRDANSVSKLIVDTDMEHLQRISVWAGNTLELAAGHKLTTHADDGNGYYQYNAGHSFNLVIGANAVLTDNIYLAQSINSTINVSGEGTYIIDGYVGTDAAGSTTTTLNIGAGTTVESLGTNTSANPGLDPSFLLAHWTGNGVVSVAGTLDLHSGISNGDGTGALTVKNGGTLVLRQGLYAEDKNITTDAINLTVEKGGTIQLAHQATASNGANVMQVNLFGGAVINALAYGEEGGAPLADETVDVLNRMRLNGAVAGETVTIQAEGYVSELNVSSSITQTDDNVSTLTLATKAGQTFTFSGNNSYSTDTILTGGGTVRAGSTTAFGTGTIVVGSTTTFDLGSLALGNNITATDATITGMTGYQGTLTAIGTVNVNGGFAGNAEIAASNTLNIGGTWKAGGTVNVAGALNVANGTLLDLSAATFTEDTGTGVFSTQLFASTGDGVNLGDLTAGGLLDISKITGAVTFGREYSISDTGVLSYIITANDLTWNTADPLAWSVGTAFDGGAFVQGDMVTFTESTTVTLGENIDTSVITVSADKTIDVIAGNELVIGNVDLAENASLNILATSSSLTATMAEGSSLTIGNVEHTATLAAGAHLTLTDTISGDLFSLERFTGSTATTQFSATFATSAPDVDPAFTRLDTTGFVGIVNVGGGNFWTSWGHLNSLAEMNIAAGTVYRLWSGADAAGAAFGAGLNIANLKAEAGSELRLNLNTDAVNSTAIAFGASTTAGDVTTYAFNGDIYVESGFLNIVNLTEEAKAANVGKVTVADGAGLVLASGNASHTLDFGIHLEDGATVKLRHYGGTGMDIVSGPLTGGVDTVLRKVDGGAATFTNMVDFQGTFDLSGTDYGASQVIISSSVTQMAAILTTVSSTSGLLTIAATAEGDTPIVINSTRFAAEAGTGHNVTVGAGSFLNITGDVTSIDPAETASFVLANSFTVNGTLDISSGVTSLGAATGELHVGAGGTLILQKGLYGVADQGAVNFRVASGATVKLHNQETASSKAGDGDDNASAQFAAGSTIMAMDATTDVLNTLQLTGSGTVAVTADTLVKDVNLSGVISGAAGLNISGTVDQTFHLNAENTYTGATTLTGGANLHVGHANALATSVLTVENGHADLATATKMAGLNLTDLSSINLAAAGGAGIEIASLTLTLAAGEFATLTMAGAVPALTGVYSETLFTGLTAENALTGIVFDSEGYAEADLYFEGLEGRLHFANGVLSLVNDPFDKLTWVGGNGNFSDTNWEGNGQTIDLLADVDIEFVAPVPDPAVVTTMTVDMVSTVGAMAVNGAEFIFEGATGGTLTINEALRVINGARVTFNFAPSIAADAVVTVGAGSNLNLIVGDQDYTFRALILQGGLESTGDITLTTASASADGSLAAAALTLANGANSFDYLYIDNALTLNEGGSLAVGSIANVGAFVGGGSLSIADGASLVIGNLTNMATANTIIGDLDLVANATATIYGQASISDLDAAGKMTVLGDLTLTEVTAAADLTVGQIAVGANPAIVADLTVEATTKSTFGTLTVTGALDASGALDITGAADVGASLDSAGAVTFAGTAKIGADLSATSVSFGGVSTVGGMLTADSVIVNANTTTHSIIDTATVQLNADSMLTVKTDATIAAVDAASTGGRLNAEGKLTVNSAINNENVVIDAVGSVALAGDNVLKRVNTDDVISKVDATQDMSLSVAEDSFATNVDAGIALMVTDENAIFSLGGATAADTNLASFNGLGSLDKQDAGALSLAAASSGKHITMGGNQLSLSGNLALTGDLTTGAGTLNLTINYEIERASASITANSLMGATGVQLAIDIDSLDGLLLGDEETYNFTALTSDLGAGFALSFATAEGVTGNVWESGSKIYTLSVKDGEIQLHLDLTGNEWTSATSNVWDSDATKWGTGMLPDAGTSAFFLGQGQKDITISGGKQVKEILVTGTYSFSGDGVAAELLTITSGKLSLSNAISVSETTSIGNGATLHLEANASVASTELNLMTGGSLLIDETAEMSIGSATANYTEVNVSQGTLTNNGALRLYGLAEEGAPNPGAEMINYEIASMEGTGALYLWSGTDVTVGDLTQGRLGMTEGANLTVTGTASVTDVVMSKGHIDAANFELLGEGSDIASMEVENLLLGAGGMQIDSLTVGEITFADGTLVAGAGAMLTVDQMNELIAGTGITLNLDGQMEGMGMGIYNVISSTGSAMSWGDMTMDADTMIDINNLVKEGKDVVYSKNGNTLSFAITEATDRRWFLSNNFAGSDGMTPGDIPDSTINPMVNNVTPNSGTLLSASLLNTVKLVYVDIDYSLDLSTANGTAVLRDLTGDAEKILTLTNGDATLSNTKQTWVEGIVLTDVNLNVALEAGSTLGHSSMNSLVATDSTVTVDQGARLTVGDMTLTDTTLTVGEGIGVIGQAGSIAANNITLNGTASTNVLASAKDSSNADSSANLEVKETLTLNDNATHNVGEGAKADVFEVVANGNSSITAANGGYSSIEKATLADNASVSTTGTGIVDIDKMESSVETNTMEGYVVLGEGEYKGSYSGSTILETKAGGKTTISTGASLEVVGNAGSKITLVDRGADNSVAGINTQGSDVYVAKNGLTVRENSTMVDSNLHFSVDADEISNQMKTGTTVDLLGNGSQLTMQNSKVVISQTDATVTLLDFTGVDLTKNYTIYDLNIDGLDASDIVFEGAALSKYFSGVEFDSTGQSLVLVFNQEGYASKISSYNGKAGSTILSPMIFSDIQTTQKDSDLAKVLNTLDLAVGEQADHIAAGVAGSAVTALGGASLASVDRQLQNVRNRVMGVGGKSMEYYMDGPVVSAWIAGEGGLSQLQEAGTAAGYDYNSFGGSFGIDVEIDESVTLGLALTALYGDLDVTSVDRSTGDFNTCNISFFAAVKHGNWNHSFIATVGIIDATLDRTVDYLTGSYDTTGSTDGLGIGLMYEAGYSYVLDKEETMTLQPIFNVAVVNATLNGYTESGGNASLEVGDQSSTYITFGLGTRFECLIGESAFNRNASFHARALVKFDAGDRYTDADVRIAGHNTKGNVKGSEPGAVGLEIGGGINIPIGSESGALFMDAGVELRDQENSVNATMGYRFSF